MARWDLDLSSPRDVAGERVKTIGTPGATLSGVTPDKGEVDWLKAGTPPNRRHTARITRSKMQ
jgi:hypothetical protein